MGQVLFAGKEPTASKGSGREVHVRLAKGLNRIRSGIYKLRIGDKFYIGGSSNIRKRATEHMKHLQRGLNGYKSPSMYVNMIDHLKANPAIEIMEVEVLEECEILSLQHREQHWLTSADGDLLLNRSRFATKSSLIQSHEDFTPGIYTIEYNIKTVGQFLAFKKLQNNPLVFRKDR